MAILNFGSILKKSLAHPHVARNVILKFRKKLTSRFLVFAPTRKPDAGQNPGATKIPYGRGIKMTYKEPDYAC